MNWDYVKTLKSANLIDEFENLVGYEFPKQSIDIAIIFLCTMAFSNIISVDDETKICYI